MLALVLAFLLPAVGAHAQQAATVHRIGVLLHHGAPPGFLEAFRAGLHDLGYLEGKNIALEIRNAEGNNDRLAALADELVRLRVDLILALNTPGALASKRATATIPIVIARVTDPVRSGLVSSLARPGGNVTGLSFNNSELAVRGLHPRHEGGAGIEVAVCMHRGVPVSAQPPQRIARVGILNYAAAQDARVTEFRDGLRELGYLEGQNLAITYRWADGRSDAFHSLLPSCSRAMLT